VRAAPLARQVARRAQRWQVRHKQRALDRRYGISTLHTPGDRYDAAPVQYEPTKYGAIATCLEHLAVRPSDVVVDIGCGMGRVACVFSMLPVARVIGIELDDRLASIARANAARVRGRRADIEIRTGDAGQADYSGVTIFWLYNPFGEETMRRTLARIRESVDAAPRPIQLVYVAPNFERPLQDSAWLDRTATISVEYDLAGDVAASFWVNRHAPAPAGPPPRTDTEA
jgi:predicted RNA methylase